MEAKELLQLALKQDPRLQHVQKNGKPLDPSSYAVRCHKHGRVILSWDEAYAANLPAQALSVDYPCPICHVRSHQDRFWHEKMREYLSYFH